MTKFWYISAAMLGMLMHSVGLVMQKKGIDQSEIKRVKDVKLDNSFMVWFIGILLAYILSVIPTGIASKGLSPQIVSSISGLTIVVVIFLSHFFLKERVYLSDILLSVVIILCISGISIERDTTPISNMNVKALCYMVAAPFLLLLPLLFKKTSNKIKTLLFASFSGLMSGLCFVLLNIAVKESGGTFWGIFKNPYPYEYTAMGFMSTVSMQAAYKFGKIINVTPLQISLGVVYPLVCSYFIYQKTISPEQDLLILVIAVCCAVIQKKH